MLDKKWKIIRYFHDKSNNYPLKALRNLKVNQNYVMLYLFCR